MALHGVLSGKAGGNCGMTDAKNPGSTSTGTYQYLGEPIVRWSINVPKSMDQRMRRYLGRIGAKHGGLRQTVMEAVDQYLGPEPELDQNELFEKPAPPQPVFSPWDWAEVVLGDRKLVGKLIREHGEPAVRKAIGVAFSHQPADPLEFLLKILAKDGPAAATNGDKLTYDKLNEMSDKELLSLADRFRIETTGKDSFTLRGEIMEAWRESRP